MTALDRFVTFIIRLRRPVSWLSSFVFFVGFVLFFCCYVGNNWYVIPPDGTAYPPEAHSIPIKMGLFWMCVYGHCKYDLRVDYLVVGYIPYPDIQYAYQNYRTACMVIITIAAISLLFAMGFKLIFLAKYKYSTLSTFPAGLAEIIAGILTLIGLILFGSQFRGSTATIPFGWCFWLMLPAILIFFLDGIFTCLLGIALVIVGRKKKQQPGLMGGDQKQPLAFGT